MPFDSTREEVDEEQQGRTHAHGGVRILKSVHGNGKVVCEGGLEVGVQPWTLKLVFGNGSGDCVWKAVSGEDNPAMEEKVREERMRRLKAWLANETEGF